MPISRNYSFLPYGIFNFNLTNLCFSYSFPGCPVPQLSTLRPLLKRSPLRENPSRILIPPNNHNSPPQPVFVCRLDPNSPTTPPPFMIPSSPDFAEGDQFVWGLFKLPS